MTFAPFTGPARCVCVVAVAFFLSSACADTRHDPDLETLQLALTMEEKVDSLRKQVLDFSKQVTAFEAQLADLTDAQAATQAALDGATASVDALEAQVSTLEAEVSSCVAICAPSCGDGLCTGDESCQTCETDCGACPAFCGDGSCDPDETCAGCPADCGTCPPACGDGVCSGGEQCVTCPADCGGCQSGGNCCVEHPEPGCHDPNTEACVCAQDDWCCPGTFGEGAWDNGCVALALACGIECVSFCGDGVCDPDEDCGSCASDCGACPPPPPSCCETNDAPGCTDPEMEACVCAIDDWCCQGAWDVWCVYTAIIECGGCGPLCGEGECVCGDGVCSDGEDCEGCSVDCGACQDKGSCCMQHGSSGCHDPSTEACVCDAKPSCCEPTGDWDSTCVLNAILCGADCTPKCGNGACNAGEDCTICPDDCGTCSYCGDGTCSGESCETCAADCGACQNKLHCCDTSPTATGCHDPLTEACVCAADSFCCNNGWDAACVNLAMACGFDCSPPVCGDGVCTFAEDCDSCGQDCGACPPPNDCCVSHFGAGCDEPDVQACVCAIDSFCCTGSWDSACISNAQFACDLVCGSYCGDGVCDYVEAQEGCAPDCL